MTTVTVMFEPALVALTSTPSIAASSAELTRPVSAATGVWAAAENGNGAAKARPKRLDAGGGEKRMLHGSSQAFFKLPPA